MRTATAERPPSTLVGGLADTGNKIWRSCVSQPSAVICILFGALQADTCPSCLPKQLPRRRRSCRDPPLLPVCLNPLLRRLGVDYMTFPSALWILCSDPLLRRLGVEGLDLLADDAAGLVVQARRVLIAVRNRVGRCALACRSTGKCH